MRYGFFGAGNLGSAVIEGMIRSGKIFPQEITVFDKVSQKSVTEAYKVNGAGTVKELTGASDILFVAVKPADCREVFDEISKSFGDGNCAVVSTVAGLSLDEIDSIMQKRAPVARIMPNLNARHCKSVTAL